LSAAIIAALLVLAACRAESVDRPPLRVLAASSLQDVLPLLEAVYRADGTTLETSFNGSSRLRVQIEQGAAADVFLSADARNVEALVAAGLADGVGVLFAANRLVLVVPRSAEPGGVASWTDLAAEGMRIVTAGDEVPIARYTDELVGRLASSEGAPAGYRAAYEANVVSLEDNVRAVLAKVEIGEADAAFVYATDAAASDAVRTLPLPHGTEVATECWALVLAGARSPAAARTFVAWLVGDEAQQVLVDHGFTPAS
jgi:molybdate transport system substrate-binding protein